MTANRDKLQQQKDIMEDLIKDRDSKQAAQVRENDSLKAKIRNLTEHLAKVDSELVTAKQRAQMLDLKLLDAVAEREVCLLVCCMLTKEHTQLCFGLVNER